MKRNRRSVGTPFIRICHPPLPPPPLPHQQTTTEDGRRLCTRICVYAYVHMRMCVCIYAGGDGTRYRRRLLINFDYPPPLNTVQKRIASAAKRWRVLTPRSTSAHLPRTELFNYTRYYTVQRHIRAYNTRVCVHNTSTRVCIITVINS